MPHTHNRDRPLREFDVNMIYNHSKLFEIHTSLSFLRDWIIKKSLTNVVRFNFLSSRSWTTVLCKRRFLVSFYCVCGSLSSFCLFFLATVYVSVCLCVHVCVWTGVRASVRACVFNFVSEYLFKKWFGLLPFCWKMRCFYSVGSSPNLWSGTEVSVA